MIVLVLGLVSEALAGLNDATAHTGDVNSIWLGWVLHVQSPSKLTRTTQEMRREERGGISPYITTRHTLLNFIIEKRVPQLAISTQLGGGVSAIPTQLGGGDVSDPHTNWGGGFSDFH